MMFEGVRSFLKLNTVCINSLIFSLHYKVTVLILIASALLVMSRQYLQDPIDCNVEGIPQHTMNAYCWAHSTYSVVHKKKLSKEEIETSIHPGIGFNEDKGTIKYHKYYQWVCYILLLQAVLFYFPYYLWKRAEGGRLKLMLFDIKYNFLEPDKVTLGQKRLVNYFVQNLNSQNGYVVKYFLCEVLNFINVVCQIFFLNSFLGGEFTTYGTKVVSFFDNDPELRNDPMEKVFPTVTKCVFKQYSFSGNINTLNAICILPLNTLNQKIFVFFWFWYIILSVLSGLIVLFWIIVFVSARFRSFHLKFKMGLGVPHIRRTLGRFEIGDWFLLRLLADNMEPAVFNEFFNELSAKLAEQQVSV